MRMGRHITQLARTGCTEQCIPCHFREVWHRELDQGSVSAFLDDDTVLTDRPVPHGETLLADGRTMMPNGIIAEISRLSLIAESEFIAVYLTIRFPALECDFTKDIVERVLIDLDELWTTDPDGNPTINASAIGGYQPSGHRIGSLPTTPVTPRNDGRPRSSHRTPPPIYSPSRPDGHPQQVLAPIALLERPRSPPPPPYSPAPSYTEQDSTLRTDELLDRPNDAIISSSEFLANLEYVLQPLAAHAPPTPVRHGRRRTRTSPLNRPARSRAIRIPPRSIEQAQPQEIAPLGQSPHPNIRPSMVSPPTRQRLPQQLTRMRRPQPITRSPNNVQLDRFRLPSPDLVMPQTSFLSSEEDSDSSELERGQPRFYMRHSPFSDETDIDFPDYSHISPRTMPVDWYTSDTCCYPDSDESESESESESSSSSYFSLNSDDNANNERRVGSISSPTNIANYRARQREARRARSDSVESFAVSDEFSDPDSDLLHL